MAISANLKQVQKYYHGMSKVMEDRSGWQEIDAKAKGFLNGFTVAKFFVKKDIQNKIIYFVVPAELNYISPETSPTGKFYQDEDIQEYETNSSFFSFLYDGRTAAGHAFNLSLTSKNGELDFVTEGDYPARDMPSGSYYGYVVTSVTYK